jgi:superkiller protein 3
LFLYLQSAKLDPYNAETFLYLGHFSLNIQNDKTRSRKCYQKCFDLDPTYEEAGAALCDLLTSSDQEDEAYKLLLSVTSKASAGW